MKPDALVELKTLRLHGMAGAWADLVEKGGNAGIETSRWLIEHLLQAEATDRAMRSVSHQMHAAKFPVHRDMAGFDFEVSPVDRKLVTTLFHLLSRLYEHTASRTTATSWRPATSRSASAAARLRRKSASRHASRRARAPIKNRQTTTSEAGAARGDQRNRSSSTLIHRRRSQRRLPPLAQYWIGKVAQI
jgi:IstB-like ATP binding protein